MPWKASSVMEERLRFVGSLLDGESMSDVCREFGISKTGYKDQQSTQRARLVRSHRPSQPAITSLDAAHIATNKAVPEAVVPNSGATEVRTRQGSAEAPRSVAERGGSLLGPSRRMWT
jgi:transposase-like protein